MPFYRGKRIEAWQCGSGPRPDWLPVVVDDNVMSSKHIEIRATKGIETLPVGDWAIKDEDGTIRTMANEKFKLRYDLVRDVQHTELGRDFQPTDAQLREVGDMMKSDRSPVRTLTQDEQVGQSAPTPPPPQPNPGAVTQPSKPAQSESGIREAIQTRQNTIDQRAAAARPNVHKHKAGEYE